MNPQEGAGSSEHADKGTALVVQRQKVYGRKHALTIEAQRNRAGDRTLGFEFAAAKPGDDGGYDWSEKLVIQLKPDHLPLYAAVLTGDLPQVRFDHYGADRNKSLEIAKQEGGVIAIKGFSEGRGHPVPVVPERLFWLSVQAIGRISDQSEGALDAIAAKALIRHTAEMWLARINHKRSKS